MFPLCTARQRVYISSIKLWLVIQCCLNCFHFNALVRVFGSNYHISETSLWAQKQCGISSNPNSQVKSLWVKEGWEITTSLMLVNLAVTGKIFYSASPFGRRPALIWSIFVCPHAKNHLWLGKNRESRCFILALTVHCGHGWKIYFSCFDPLPQFAVSTRGQMCHFLCCAPPLTMSPHCMLTHHLRHATTE